MLGGILNFEAFNAGHMLNKAAKNPEQLLLGAADPLGAKLWGGITGKEYSPIVNEWGGATEDAYKAAEAKGINTAAGRGMHNVAQSIAGIYAGGAAANGLGFGAKAAGNAGQGLQVGSGSATSPYSLAPSTTRTGLLSGNAGQGLSMGAGNGVQLSQAGTPAASGGIFSSGNLKTASDIAGIAGQMGVFGDPQQAPAAQSAGIPARQADFSGLLRSQGQANNAAGAQRLLQQQMARKQGRL